MTLCILFSTSFPLISFHGHVLYTTGSTTGTRIFLLAPDVKLSCYHMKMDGMCFMACVLCEAAQQSARGLRRGQHVSAIERL